MASVSPAALLPLTAALPSTDLVRANVSSDYGIRLKNPSTASLVVEFFEEDADQAMKAAKAICTLVATALSQNGKLVQAQAASNVARAFAEGGHWLKGLVGAPVCLLHAFHALTKVYGPEAGVQILQALKSFSDAAYASVDTVTIFAGESLSLVAQKIASLVSLAGGLLSPVFGIALAGIHIAKTFQPLPSPQIVDRNGVALPKLESSSRSGPAETAQRAEYVREYSNQTEIANILDSANRSSRVEGGFKLLKNIAYLAMSIIAVLAVLASITMAPAVSVIVMSALSIFGIAMSAGAHVSSHQKQQRHTEALIKAANSTVTIKPHNPAAVAVEDQVTAAAAAAANAQEQHRLINAGWTPPAAASRAPSRDRAGSNASDGGSVDLSGPVPFRGSASHAALQAPPMGASHLGGSVRPPHAVASSAATRASSLTAGTTGAAPA